MRTELDVMREIVKRVKAFEATYDVSPNVIVLGADLINAVFPEYSDNDSCYIYGMQIIVSHEAPEQVNVGYIATGSVYRHEACPNKRKCYDYMGYHCEGCNGVKEY